MSKVVRAFRLGDGKEGFAREMAAKVRARAAEAAAFYAQFGVTAESWHLQKTDQGTWLIGVTDVAGRPLDAVAAEFAASQRPFDRWFKDQIREMSGVDPDKDPLGPPTECIFSWPK